MAARAIQTNHKNPDQKEKQNICIFIARTIGFLRFEVLTYAKKHVFKRSINGFEVRWHISLYFIVQLIDFVKFGKEYHHTEIDHTL